MSYILQQKYIIGAFYSLKPVEKFALVFVLLSPEGFPQMCYYKT